MVRKFDIITKPLDRAKPCIAQLLRDNGDTEWYEDCKAGQLLQIETGRSKAYLDLDVTKIRNFNSSTPEQDIEEARQIMTAIDKEKERLEKEIEKETDKLKKELNSAERLKYTEKRDAKKEQLQTEYEKRVEKLRGKYVLLEDKKKKNFGTIKKPIMGFVCYEKEFSALPNNVLHDSRSITRWLDDIMKNYKDFVVQRIEAIKGLWIAVGLVAIALLFIFLRYGDKILAKKEPPVPEGGDIAVISSVIPIIRANYRQWQKKE